VSKLKLFHASALALTLIGALCGCAAYEKCGFGGCPGDTQLAAAVRTAFEAHPELEPPNLLKVQSVDHVIYLYGLVDTDFQRQMAESVAHQAPGVAKVINSIGLSGNSR
jgi:osmotically-inducible protein OsmY